MRASEAYLIEKCADVHPFAILQRACFYEPELALSRLSETSLIYKRWLKYCKTKNHRLHEAGSTQ